MFSDNPEFKEVFRLHDIVLYMPTQITDYHKSRELAMQAQDRYSRCGIDPNTLKAFATMMLNATNSQLTSSTFRSDMAVIGNNILARLREPVDELCAIRMGAIACFMDGEDPNRVHNAWTDKKIRLAEQNPQLYAFFLDTGIAFIPEYAQLLRTSGAEEYFQKRREMLSALIPQ